jgi:archaellum component FlaC
MQRILPSFLDPSCLEIQSTRIWASDLLTQALLAAIHHFLAQQHRKIRESRDSYIRMKSMIAAQQTIICRMNALEARQREVLAHHSAIEAGLSEVRESANRTERELSELITEVQLIGSMSKAVREAFFQRADGADERLTWSENGAARLAAEVKALQAHSDGAHKQIEGHKDDISMIKEDLKQLKGRVTQVQRSPIPAPQSPVHTPGPPPPPPPSSALDSLIVSEFPPLFKEFHAKRFNLLWRGSRDGFGAAEFHHRCDGRANTQTLIQDTAENVFGSITPVKWESRSIGSEKGDGSLRSFLFTLMNPHGVPARKFPLTIGKKQCTIFCYCRIRPRFGDGDIRVSDNSNANADSWTHFGTRYHNGAYTNDTSVKDFFTGAVNFTVNEIEVFEIAD